MASIGWIDFSTTDRNRVGSILDLLRPEGMVDELGMGTMRDGLANQLFPGISTIQTRAKYFFIIPYILYDYQKLKPAQRKGKTPSRYLEEQEYEIMWNLADKYRHEDGSGVIGITKKRPEKIVRRPSAIYWNGLYTYQFIDTSGLGVEGFLQQTVNPNLDSLLSSFMEGDDAVNDDADAEYENTFHLRIPPKLNWNENLTLDLEQDEAELFMDRILSISKNKLIAELLINEDLWSLFQQAGNFQQFALAASSLGTLPASIRDLLILAHDFSALMHGAHITYNCLLQKMVFDLDYYTGEWETWLENIQTNMIDYDNFNPEVLFSYSPTTRSSSEQFVREWWKQTRLGFPDLNKRNDLVKKQEAMVKRSKARLLYNKTDEVREGKWMGLKHFEYRFGQGRTILTDIKTALNQ
ncbi:MAG: hypothetical protein JW833_08535 [Prolixibacteraceae bacterium]|nr:hypothetical protein [Prolixibacteraceae bacterium]